MFSNLLALIIPPPLSQQQPSPLFVAHLDKIVSFEDIFRHSFLHCSCLCFHCCCWWWWCCFCIVWYKRTKNVLFSLVVVWAYMQVSAHFWPRAFELPLHCISLGLWCNFVVFVFFPLIFFSGRIANNYGFEINKATTKTTITKWNLRLALILVLLGCGFLFVLQLLYSAFGWPPFANKIFKFNLVLKLKIKTKCLLVWIFGYGVE